METTPATPVTVPEADASAHVPLTRSRNNTVIGGVLGGIAERYGVDATLLRILFVAAFLFTGFPLVVYVIAWLWLPENESQPKQAVDAEIQRSNVVWLKWMGLAVVGLTAVGTLYSLYWPS